MDCMTPGVHKLGSPACAGRLHFEQGRLIFVDPLCEIDVTVLAPKILSWPLDFSKMFGILLSIVTH